MKTTISLMTCLVLAGLNIFAQNACYPTITTSQIGTEGGIFDETCIQFSPQIQNILYYQSDHSWQYASPNIHIKPQPGTSWSFNAKGINNTSSGSFYLSSFNSDLSFLKFPQGNVEKDHLLELRLTYPAIKEKINKFLDDSTGYYKPSYDNSSGYVIGYNNGNGTIINPYDPDHISVDAVFWRPNSNADGLIRYGFYYKGYTRITNDWAKSTTDTLEWRIRFSPDQTGKWYYFVNIWIGGKKVAKSGLDSINVTPTTDPGYVKVANEAGENKQYLKFSNTNNTFIPIGNDYAWTGADYTRQMHLNKEKETDERMKPDAQIELQKAMNRLNGHNNERANATRLIFSPWSFHIEYERLNNYNTRQIEMWELDDYLHSLEARKMYLTLGIILQDEFRSISTDSLAWRKNPYNINVRSDDPNKKYKGVDSVITPRDFYRIKDAMKFFKKRLRYINARWGYSTNLMLYELHSEIDLTGLFSDSLGNFIQDTTTMGHWYDEMANYMKQDLKCKQLVSMSIGNGGDTQWQQLELFKHANMDIVLPHIYLSRESVTRCTSNAIRTINTFLVDNPKPVFIQECGNTGYMDKAMFCTDLLYHQVSWSYNFMGLCGVLNWPFAFLYPLEVPTGFDTNLNISSHSPYEGEYYTNLEGIRRFFAASGLDFRTKKYLPRIPYMDADINNQWYEMQYMVSEDKNSIIGWFHNRSSNQFNCKDCLNNHYFDIKTDLTIVTNFTDYKRYECLINNTDVPWWNMNSPNTFGRPNNKCQDIPDSNWAGEDNYNRCFNTDPFPTSDYGMVGKGPQPISLTSLNSGQYNIQWYWTWNDTITYTYAGEKYIGDALVPNLSVNGSKTSNGTLDIYSPPTVWYGPQGKVYPGDWAVIIKYENSGNTNKQLIKSTEVIEDTKIIEIKVTPNPTNGKVNILNNSFKQSYSVQLFGPSGNFITKINNITTEIFTIDLSDQANGIYILKVISRERSDMFKVVKM